MTAVGGAYAAAAEDGGRGAERRSDHVGPQGPELARHERVKKFGAAMPADFKEKAGQMRFLQYRGFEQDHIRAAVGSGRD